MDTQDREVTEFTTYRYNINCTKYTKTCFVNTKSSATLTAHL